MKSRRQYLESISGTLGANWDNNYDVCTTSNRKNERKKTGVKIIKHSCAYMMFHDSQFEQYYEQPQFLQPTGVHPFTQ